MEPGASWDVQEGYKQARCQVRLMRLRRKGSFIAWGLSPPPEPRGLSEEEDYRHPNPFREGNKRIATSDIQKRHHDGEAYETPFC